MPLPRPAPGLVIGYAYLWRHEYRRRRQEGVKARPCVILSVATTRARDFIVTVAPMTHLPPDKSSAAIAVPRKIKRHLELDDSASWIVADEVNRFIWPGPDLRPVSRNRPDRFHYGYLPEDLFEALRDRIVAVHSSDRLTIVPRGTE